MWRNAKNNQQQIEWMADSVTLSVSLFCFIHSLANRTKTECNVKQRLNGSNFFYYSFYFLLQHSTSFAFWAPPRSSTPSCRCDLEARGWEDTSSNVDHLRLASACAPALWADLAAILATEAAIWDLGVGWGNLGSGEERGAWLARIVLRFVHDSSTWRTMAGGRKELRMRPRPNWLLDTCSNQWGLNDESDDFFLPMTTNHIQLLSVRLTIHILDEDQDGCAEKCPQEQLHRLDRDHCFHWIVIKRKRGGGKKGKKTSECSVAGFSSSTNELRPWWTFDALFSHHTIARLWCWCTLCSNLWFPRH